MTKTSTDNILAQQIYQNLVKIHLPLICNQGIISNGNVDIYGSILGFCDGINNSTMTQTVLDLSITNNSNNSGCIKFSAKTAGAVIVEPLKLSATLCEFGTDVNYNGGKNINLYSVVGRNATLRIYI